MPGEPLRPGDPVTLLLPDHVVMVEVNTSSRVDFTVQLSSRGEKTYTSRWGLNEEGSGWLRGYHTADSREVEAARAAKGLELVPAPQEMPGAGGPHGGGSAVGSHEQVRKWVEELIEAGKTVK